ncbi:pyrroline-5-carboxylate reductase [Desulfurobacterium atlanticum]|uniref:Pyrroline-5-carboxylate reductase n=1 Tax=Desulfurobacterium atlanticum TaxID=240169 RepID=A0A238Y500_9BACT|nr:pyrroline-5-carboxylate reductase [Desulfurobacterium atlanticum]SNR65409.1 pyrroline-5-carboxylate reductase [Desulfurobacterium atlanticum]
MNASVGFIGGGKMAEAIISALIDSETVKPEKINVSDISEERLKYLKERYKVNTYLLNTEVAAISDIVVLVVKPQIAELVLEELREVILSTQLFISVVAGLSIGSIESIIGSNKKIIRAMPNILVKIKEGTIGYCINSNVEMEDCEFFECLFKNIAEVVKVEEYLMDAVTGLAGSGPAFVFLMIQALADGGVRAGLPRDKAIKLAAQTVKGAAALVLKGEHPEILKDSVMSPAGTTAEGIVKLEEKAVRSAFIEAVFAAYKRSKEISELMKKKG